MKRTIAIPALLMGILLPACAGTAASPYPEIRVLSQDDSLFLQQQYSLDEFRRLMQARSGDRVTLPQLALFAYAKKRSEDLFSLNARIGLRYDTLATLNGTISRDAFNAQTRILIPSQDGLFVNNPPRGWLEELMLSTRLADGKKPQGLVIAREGRKDIVYFFPGDAFTGLERKYFLGMLLRLPIDKPRFTSLYGWRNDPFTGKREFHDGLDLGAPEGTEVHAARDGAVAETGTNSELGNYVIISHPGGLQTVYGHLSSIHVIMNQQVNAGAVIGAVGHTGYATGPHLHFEVREKGTPTDPAPLLTVKKG